MAGTLEIRALGLAPPETGPGAGLAGLRAAADRALRASIPEPASGLAAGVLLGLRERVPRPVTADFVATGLSHVVAISGWNIAIVVAGLAALLRRAGRRPRIAVTLVVVGAYVALVGASPPVVRAALMAGIVLTAREAGRAAGAAAALAWAVTAMLVADPAAIDDQGFRLSSAATAGLLAWGTPLTARIARLWGGRVPGPVVEALGVSLAAQAATLPFVLAGFGRVSLVSPAVNLVVAPIVAPAMAAKLVDLLVPAQPGSTRTGYMKSLTEREREILEHLAHGKSNKAIALVLGISHDTVKLHVRHILSKLNLRSRVEAAVFAVENRTATPSD
jgi:competence protein ComEC